MAGKERVRDHAELEASRELREATSLAASLIRNKVGKDWSGKVSSTHREYSIRRAPYAIFEGDGSVGRPAVMSRLIVRDFRESPPPGMALFHVLELPPLPVGKEEIRLKDGVKDDLSEAFLPARDFACIRFWIDIEHELGSGLHNYFSSEDRDRLREYRTQAMLATASVVEARRVALKMTQDALAGDINVSLDQVFGIEGGNITINAPLLDRIEVAFARRERTMGFTPQEISHWLARRLSALASPGNQGRANGAASRAPSGAVAATAPRPKHDLPMLVEPPESENLDPPDWEGGARMREQRKMRRVSIAKFAEAARMQPGHVARLERGDLRPSPEVDERIRVTIANLDSRGRQPLS